MVTQQIFLKSGARLGLALSQGGIQSLLKVGLSEADIGIDRLRETAGAKLGPRPQRWFWSSRIRLGIV